MRLQSKDGWRKLMEKLTPYFNHIKEFTKKYFSYIKKYISEFLKISGEKLSDICLLTEEATIYDLSKIHIFLRKCLIVAKKLITPTIKAFLKFTRKLYKKILKKSKKPINKVKKVIPAIKNQYKAYGFKKLFLKLKTRLKTDIKFRNTFINYTSPFAGVFLFIFVVTIFSNITYALEIEQDGKVVAFVSNEAIYTEAKNDLQSRIVTTSGDKILEINPNISVVSVSKRKLSNAMEVTDNLILTSDKEIVEADGLYVDDKFYGAVTDKTLIQSILDETLDKYRSEEGNEKVEFTKNVELKSGFYLKDSIVSNSEMKELLLSDVKAQRTYTIQKGDSPTLIADKNGVPYALFKAMNPTLEQRCMIGDEAIVAQKEPFLSVTVTKEVTYTEDIPYKIETTKDSSKNVGYTKIVQEGKEGSREVTALIKYVDNIEDSREVITSTTLEEPVTKKVITGTKVTYQSGSSYIKPSSGSGKVNGKFIWPVGGSGGKISCYYGSRGHRGLDIAAPYGTSIVASADGKVVVSGWYYSYGKCVVIDHGNGVRTLYAHNSSLNVSVGQYVSQGQKIAGCGSTGYSTGNHCHFEVQINGGTRNPLNYIG